MCSCNSRGIALFIFCISSDVSLFNFSFVPFSVCCVRCILIECCGRLHTHTHTQTLDVFCACIAGIRFATLSTQWSTKTERLYVLVIKYAFQFTITRRATLMNGGDGFSPTARRTLCVFFFHNFSMSLCVRMSVHSSHPQPSLPRSYFIEEIEYTKLPPIIHIESPRIASYRLVFI